MLLSCLLYATLPDHLNCSFVDMNITVFSLFDPEDSLLLISHYFIFMCKQSQIKPIKMFNLVKRTKFCRQYFVA